MKKEKVKRIIGVIANAEKQRSQAILREIVNEFTAKGESHISVKFAVDVVVATFDRYGVKLEGAE